MAVGYAGYGTPEQVRRRREIAEALAAQSLRSGRAPQSIGDALSQGGSQFGAALASRGIRKKADKAERKGRESARGSNRDAIARALSGLSGGQSRSPVSPTRQERGGAVQPSSAPAQGLPPGMMDAVIQQESGGDPNAVSPKGATGIGQVMPATARDPGYGVPSIFDTARQLGKPVPDESDATLQKLMRDPEVNRTFSTNYMSAMHREQGGNLETTLAAYNAGPGAVQQHGGVPPYAETQNYVQSVQGRMAQAPAASMTDAGPQGGQPAPQQQIDAEAIQTLQRVLNEPWSSEGDKAMAQMLLQQHMERMAPPEPMSQYERARLGMDQRKLGFEREKFGAEYGMDRERLELEREKARSTGDLTEYDRYVEQQKARGQEPLGFLEYQRTLAESGSNKNIGTIPAGYQTVPTPEGGMRMEPIPGGPAEREQQQAAEQDKQKEALKERYAGVVLDDIGRVRKRVENSALPITGLKGSFLSNIPGTSAHDVSKLTDTIRANVGFDRLQQMRDASPTGGALGQVSELENRLLQATLGNLELSQTEDQFMENLNRLEEVYLDIIHGPGNRPETPKAKEEGEGGKIQTYNPATGDFE